MFIHLTVHRAWKNRVVQEMRQLLDKYDATPESLDRIPYSAWSTELPLLDMTANEILRSHSHGILLRQNLGEAFEIDGHMIPRGACVAYPAFDAHQSTEFYDAPHEFGPGRIEEMMNEKNYSFIAWGRGTFCYFWSMHDGRLRYHSFFQDVILVRESTWRNLSTDRS